MSPQAYGGVTEAATQQISRPTTSSKTSQYSSFYSQPCSPFVDLTAKTDNVNFRADFCPLGPISTSGNVYSCIEVCNQPSCKDGCQNDKCEPGCVSLSSGSEFCYGPYICDSTNCDGTSVHDAPPVCLDDGCPFTFLDRDESLDNNQISANLEPIMPTLGMMDQSLQCRWELPDVQCDVSLPSANALGQHIYQDHIEPQVTFFPWEQNNVVRTDQQPAAYLCQWGSCRRSFSDHAALERHVKVAHTNLDCRWAGCEVSTESPTLLKAHVNVDHLNINQDVNWQPYTYGYKPSFGSPTPLKIDGETADTQDTQDTSFGSEGRYQAPTSQDAVANYPGHQLGVYGNAQQGSYSSFNNVHTSAVNFSQQIPWPVSPVVRPAPSTVSLSSSFNNLQGSSQTQLPSSVTGSFRTNPVQNQDLHTCRWVADYSSGQVCGATFTDANILQTHVNEEHITKLGSDGILCNWQDCKRNQGPKPAFPNKEKLKRHMYTHTGCKFHIIHYPLASSSPATPYKTFIYVG